MISLDSVYAMLAKPVLSKLKTKEKVKRIDNSAAISADSHEPPQSQLPPHLERRSSSDDRRKDQQIAYQLDPCLERRKGARKDRRAKEAQDNPEELTLPQIAQSAEATHSNQPTHFNEPASSTESEPATKQSESIHTKIDINV